MTVPTTQDWEHALSGDLFTFICSGDESSEQTAPINKSFRIYTNLVAKVSFVMDAMMNNGTMSESLSKIATLAEVEGQTFVLFCQWLYTGIYRLAAKPATLDQKRHATTRRRYCTVCGESTLRAGSLCRDACNDEYNYGLKGQQRRVMYCIGCGEPCFGSQLTYHICLSCTNKELRQPIFTQREYCVEETSQEDFSAYLTNIVPSLDHSNDLISHAKLYCFALQYMIEPLKQTCMHLLQRDMYCLILNADSVSAVVSLVDFTYDDTSAALKDDETQGRLGEDLRNLVLRFILALKEDIVQYKEFKALLYKAGDFVVDFVQG
jgi:hypothetical protein